MNYNELYRRERNDPREARDGLRSPRDETRLCSALRASVPGQRVSSTWA